MKYSLFNPDIQHKDLSSKIVAGLERLSEAFRVLLWEHAKVIGLSPIQIQILIFVAYHDEKLCNVSHLAKEFNITKPTISDAVRVLHKKELIKKISSSTDKRAYSIALTSKGSEVVNQTQHFAAPFHKIVENLSEADQRQLFTSISKVIFELNKEKILVVQRTCYNCRFFNQKTSPPFCKLIEKNLLKEDIRVDCPEFEQKNDHS